MIRKIHFVDQVRPLTEEEPDSIQQLLPFFMKSWRCDPEPEQHYSV